MARSWDHSVEAMTAEYLELYERLGWTCAAGKCMAKATHWTKFRIITGRAGRVGNRMRRACPDHARKFAAKHSLAMAESEVA